MEKRERERGERRAEEEGQVRQERCALSFQFVFLTAEFSGEPRGESGANGEMAGRRLVSRRAKTGTRLSITRGEGKAERERERAKFARKTVSPIFSTCIAPARDVRRIQLYHRCRRRTFAPPSRTTATR